ncbi:MAG: D-serine ammonia-lyase [Ferruginibacter sp.]|nr:D-serine ammonia-lyase [Ferruginibacter sp.]
MSPFRNLAEWIRLYPEMEPVIKMSPVFWFNSRLKSMETDLSLPLRRMDMERGRDFLEKYASYIAEVFPSTRPLGGHIQSPLREINRFKFFENEKHGAQIEGRMFLKCDSDLAVAGSIKARGGFFEVLQFAHKLAVKGGFIKDEEAAKFSLPELMKLFSKYTIGVGSTGNLGLSIGIISAKLGFKVNVYMSNDAKEWKKNLLRDAGANVIEEEGDFGVAITKGRNETLSNPYGYFVDDENSSKLFLGYSLAGFEIQQQLDELGIKIDKEHPLFVYSPCGVGGSPGGVMFGLKNIFGDSVHCFFAEPTHSPAVLTGLITGKREKVSVHDFGIDNITEADGLAVGRPSAFASSIIDKLVSGIYTVEDEVLFRLLKDLFETENIFVEPSATAGMIGPGLIQKSGYFSKHNINPLNVTHIAWATGGSLVPENLRVSFLKG